MVNFQFDTSNIAMFSTIRMDAASPFYFHPFENA